MINNNKHAWSWNIKPEKVDEYVEIHKEVWPDVLKVHSEGGIYNYSIFQNGNQFFYCFQCDDVEKAFDMIGKSEICQKWNAITSQMVDGSFNFEEEDPIKFLEQVFYLA